MTDEDRKKAVATWAKFPHEYTAGRTYKENWMSGYAAACEAKRYGEKPCPICGDHFESNEALQKKLEHAELGRKLAHDEDSRRIDEWSKCAGQLEAERARSAKLIEALEKYAGFQISKWGWRETGRCFDLAGIAIAEYEASRD